jgi:hypothetical protein
MLVGPPSPNYCGRFEMKRGTVWIADAKRMTVAEFAARAFRDTLDRPVIDRTVSQACSISTSNSSVLRFQLG